MEVGRWVRTWVEVSLGHVVRWPALVAWLTPGGDGLGEEGGVIKSDSIGNGSGDGSGDRVDSRLSSFGR
jgi:hypothetical protein